MILHADKHGRPSILEEAGDLVVRSRQNVYGTPLENFSQTGKLWSAILGVEVSAGQVALCMVALKISRLCKSPRHRDSLVDLAGYARAYEMVFEEQDRRESQP